MFHPSGSFIFYGPSVELNLEVAYAVSIKYLGKGNEWYIRNNIYQDFFIIKDDISIDNARSMIEFLNNTSEFGGYKIAVVNGVNINKNTANAILKILEEPPAKSLIIITTTKFFSLLPTIRSRCRKIFVDGQRENICQENLSLCQKCFNFFNEKSKDIINFAKSINEEELHIFLKFTLQYSYIKFMNSKDKNDARRYLELSELVEKSINTHTDQQTLIAVCCMLI